MLTLTNVKWKIKRGEGEIPGAGDEMPGLIAVEE